MPRLSIVMPLFNTSEFVGEAIASILNQTFTDFELIVVDDASGDNSAGIVQSYNDKRIRLLINDTHQGIVYSRNRGLEIATGEYYAPFDSDDTCLPSKFQKQIDFLKSRTDFGMVGSWIRMIDSQGFVTKEKWKLNASHKAIPSIMLFRNYFGQPSVVIRREAIPINGYTKGFEIGEDYRMWAEIVRSWKAWNYPEYLTFYRIHPNSRTHTDPALYRESEKKLYDYIYEPLGIKISDRQCDLLRIIKGKDRISDPEILSEIEEFCLLIQNKNLALNFFDPYQLKKVIANRWIKVCLKYRGRPVKATTKCLFSPQFFWFPFP